MDVAYGFLHTEVSFPKEGTEFVGGTHQGPYFWSINPPLLPLSVAIRGTLKGKHFSTIASPLWLEYRI